jgi:hypothetical protein
MLGCSGCCVICICMLANGQAGFTPPLMLVVVLLVGCHNHCLRCEIPRHVGGPASGNQPANTSGQATIDHLHLSLTFFFLASPTTHSAHFTTMSERLKEVSEIPSQFVKEGTLVRRRRSSQPLVPFHPSISFHVGICARSSHESSSIAIIRLGSAALRLWLGLTCNTEVWLGADSCSLSTGVRSRLGKVSADSKDIVRRWFGGGRQC